MPIDRSEDIGKAVCSDKFDPATGEVSPSLFVGTNSSVSRLAICPIEETWDLFRRHVEKPPQRRLERIGTINVGDLETIGKNFAPNPTELTVEPDPMADYPSHAVIPQRISRGLANVIVRNLKLVSEE
jgi:hypothetical protein